MMQYEPEKSIETTKKGFEESFESGTLYNRQTQDTAHLEAILNCLHICPGMNILDLGTGTGYLAFPVAEKYPEANITGLDIVEKALERNRERAKLEDLKNIQFVNYDGINFPFPDKVFDMVITRYALHHFPVINGTFREINRILKPKGRLFLSDPTPNDDDTDRFVDAYMQMKNDGHIKFYTKEEWQTIGSLSGLKLVDSFITGISFPRNRHNATGFDSIVRKYNERVMKGYQVKIMEDEIWITEKVNNLLFQKVNALT